MALHSAMRIRDVVEVSPTKGKAAFNASVRSRSEGSVLIKCGTRVRVKTISRPERVAARQVDSVY